MTAEQRYGNRAERWTRSEIWQSIEARGWTQTAFRLGMARASVARILDHPTPAVPPAPPPACSRAGACRAG